MFPLTHLIPNRGSNDLFTSSAVNAAGAELTGTHPVGTPRGRGSSPSPRSSSPSGVASSSFAPLLQWPPSLSEPSSSSLEPRGCSFGRSRRGRQFIYQRLWGAARVNESELPLHTLKVDEVVIAFICGYRQASSLEQAPAIIDGQLHVNLLRSFADSLGDQN